MSTEEALAFIRIYINKNGSDPLIEKAFRVLQEALK